MQGPVSVPSASAPAAASEPPQKISEMGDPGLQVNFDDDETEEEPSPQGPPAMPLAMRLQRAPVTSKVRICLGLFLPVPASFGSTAADPFPACY